MKKLHSILTLMLFCLFFCAQIPFAQADDLIPLWGPEIFVKAPCDDDVDDCGAQVFERTVATLGVKPPYSIQVFTGDAVGEHQVSSARIWIDDTEIYRSSNFKNQPVEFGTEVALSNQSILRVMIDGAPLSQLNVVFQGYAPGTLRIVGPNGGRLEYSNSVILDIPAKAVDDYTPIEITPLPCDVVDSIVLEESISIDFAGCAAAFHARPEGLVFDVPISAELPITPTAPGDGFPIFLGVNIEDATFHYRPTDLLYDGAVGTVVVNGIEHFSDAIVEWIRKQATHCQGDPICEVFNNALNDTCSQCNTFDSEICAVLDPIQPAYCYLDLRQRAICGSKGVPPPEDQDCCKEKTVRVKSDFTELTSDDCTIVGDTVEVTFLDCPDQETEKRELRDKTEGCGAADPKLSIEPGVALLDVGEQQTFKVTIKAINKDGSETHFSPVDVEWWSYDPAIVYVPPGQKGETAVATAVKPGKTSIGATVTSTDLKETALVEVGEQDNPVDIALVVESDQASYYSIGWEHWQCPIEEVGDHCAGWPYDTWSGQQGWASWCPYPGYEIPGSFQVENPDLLGISLQEEGPFVSGRLSITFTCGDDYIARTDPLWFKALGEGVTRVGYCVTSANCDPLQEPWSIGQWDQQVTIGTAVVRPPDVPGLRQIGAQVAAELAGSFKDYRFGATAFGAHPGHAVECSGYDGEEWYPPDWEPYWELAPYRDFLDFTSDDATITAALGQVRMICDDPLPVWPTDSGKSVYSAAMHAIKDFPWREKAFRTVVVYSVNPACYVAYGPYCDTEVVTGYTSQDVIDAALAANVRLITINAGSGKYEESMRGPFQNMALQTKGWYTEDASDAWPMLTMFQKAFQWVLNEEPRLGKK